MPPINVRTTSPAPIMQNLSDISTSSAGNDESLPLRKSVFHWMSEAAKRNGRLKAGRNHQKNTATNNDVGPVYQKPKSLSYNDTSTGEPTSTPLLASWNPTTAYPELFASFEKSFEELLASHPTQSMAPAPTTASLTPHLHSNPTDEIDSPPASPPKKQDDGVEIFFETNFSANSPPQHVFPESSVCQGDFPAFESAISPIKLDDPSLEEPTVADEDNNDKSDEDEEFDDLMRDLQKDFENEAEKNAKLNDNAVQQLQQQEDLEYLNLMRDFEEEFELDDHGEDLYSEVTEASAPMDRETFQELRKAFNAYTAARGKKVEFREDIDVRVFQRTSSEKRSLFRKIRRRARRNNAKEQKESKQFGSNGSTKVISDPVADVVRLIETTLHELEEAGSEWKKKLKSWTAMNVLEVFSGNMICASPNQSVNESKICNVTVEMNQKQKLAALSDLVQPVDPSSISGATTSAPTTKTATDATSKDDSGGEEKAKARWQGLVKAVERSKSPEKKTHRRRPSADRDRKRNVVDGAKRWAAAQKSPASVASKVTETETPSSDTLVVPRDIFVRSPSNSATRSLQQPRLVDDAADDNRSSLLRMRLDRAEVEDIAHAKREAQSGGKKQHKRSSSSVSPVSVANLRSF